MSLRSLFQLVYTAGQHTRVCKRKFTDESVPYASQPNQLSKATRTREKI